jgi:RimJ/RimL family protein N-acetyltransferase
VPDNQVMLGILKKLGFSLQPRADSSMVDAAIDL